jgi:truncated hemoglobin YjbI
VRSYRPWLERVAQTPHPPTTPHTQPQESHFNAIVEHFVATMQDLGVSQEDIDEAVAVVATTKDAVLAA